MGTKMDFGLMDFNNIALGSQFFRHCEDKVILSVKLPLRNINWL